MVTSGSASSLSVEDPRLLVVVPSTGQAAVSWPMKVYFTLGLISGLEPDCTHRSLSEPRDLFCMGFSRMEGCLSTLTTIRD